MIATPTVARAPGFLAVDRCRVTDLVAVLEDRTDEADYPFADHVEQDVVVYDAVRLRESLTGEEPTRALEAEIARALADGPGIIVFAGAFEAGSVERVSAAFNAIIEEQRASGTAAGDHFAVPGANDRVWNALEKLAIADPGAFVDYYSNDMVALAARAWLGPAYQVTSQVNVVNPGGQGQTVHRDYHLGFLGPEAAANYPAHVHRLSPGLTLQGAIAHCDMPVESGPTLYLPHSQNYLPGYVAYALPEFQGYFLDHHVQLPLRAGDAVFFNPALFHAAGSNHTTDIRRMANLLQISSAFGRAMETVDRTRIVESIYPDLLTRKGSGATTAELTHVVAASAEGYAFPSNLDRDRPIGGMSPSTMADVVTQALAADVPADELSERLAGHVRLHQSH